MTQHPYLFDMNDLLQTRLESVRNARALPPGTERDKKRQIARSLKRLIESQIQAQDRTRLAERRVRHEGGARNRRDDRTVRDRPRCGYD
jgi:hypothetical protein